MINNQVTSIPENSLLAPEPTELYTLYYHEGLRRYLISSGQEPTPDFIEKPGEGSYKLFGGRRDSTHDVYEIGKANSIDELKQFIMVMNSIIIFDPTDNHHVGGLFIRTAFNHRLSNVIIAV